jgi:hypothetical protein
MTRRSSEDQPATGRWAALLWPKQNPGAMIYGTIVAAAVLATEAATGNSLGEMAGTILATLVVYWLAHVYADLLARQALAEGDEPVKPTWGALVASMTQELGIIVGGAGMVAVLVVVDLAGASQEVAVDAAQLCSIAQLVAWGVFAARRAHLRYGWMLLYALTSAALGVLIGLLKIALH